MKERAILFALLFTCMLIGSAQAQVSYERLTKASQEPHNWLTYSGNYAGWHHSALNQIDTKTVEHLQMQWAFQTGSTGLFEATPLVVDGVMYVTAQNNTAFALDARTGRKLWSYTRKLPPGVSGANRGFAVLGDKVFMATLDAHVVALDAKTGDVIWDVVSADYRVGFSFTHAPLVVRNKVIVGVGAGEFCIRGFIDAYDVETGKLAWRFYTIPAPGEPGNDTWPKDYWKIGGAPAWMSGTYDHALNTLYWGVGNPAPDFYGKDRPGLNLYTNSVLALDPDTGKLKWYFQFTPHDTHDWDAVEIPLLLDLELNRQARKLLVQANRNGFYYVLDRTDGKLLLAQPFVKTTWAGQSTPGGLPVALPNTEPTPEGVVICPGNLGGTNWWSPSYSPQTGLFYVVARDQCDEFFGYPQPCVKGRDWIAGGVKSLPGNGALRALDPRTGELKWEFKYHTPPYAGALSTGGGLVFAGDMEGNLIANDARTGAELWHRQTGAQIQACPMTYAVDGKQYVAISSASALFAFALPEGIGARTNVAGHGKGGQSSRLSRPVL